MQNLIISLLTAIMITSDSCSPKEKADLVIINGKFSQSIKTIRLAEAIAVKGEKIIAVGTTSEISAMIDKGNTQSH